MGPCVALSTLSSRLIVYAAPGNGVRVPRSEGSAGHIVRLLQQPSRLPVFLCLARGDYWKQGNRAQLSNNRRGVMVRVEQRALFQPRPCSGCY
jgi:hypothetical protein